MRCKFKRERYHRVKVYQLNCVAVATQVGIGCQRIHHIYIYTYIHVFTFFARSMHENKLHIELIFSVLYFILKMKSQSLHKPSIGYLSFIMLFYAKYKVYHKHCVSNTFAFFLSPSMNRSSLRDKN